MPVHRFRAGDFLIAVSFWISRFGEMKSVPHPAQRDFTPKGFHRPTGRFHPSARTDFVEKTSFVFQTKEVFSGTPEGTRTPDLLVRSQSLYPTELPAHGALKVPM